MRKIRRIIKWLTLLTILAYHAEPAKASARLALFLQAMESMRSTLIPAFLAELAQAYVPPVQSARVNRSYVNNNKKRLQTAVSFFAQWCFLLKTGRRFQRMLRLRLFFTADTLSLTPAVRSDCFVQFLKTLLLLLVLHPHQIVHLL